jgi:hypothetical protein
MKLNGLIVTPVLPQVDGQGNRARVYDICSQLAKFSDLHLLYYLYETVGEAEFTFNKFSDLKNLFNLILPVVPTVKIQPPPNNKNIHELDEWWDPIMGGTLKYLSDNFKYDYVLVNYLWLSKALEFFPSSVVKVIDAHDKFADRKSIYTSLGVEPEFFYTDLKSESKGLSRSDIVIGIQEEDSKYFKKITNADILTIPHLAETNLVNPDKKGNHNLIKIGLLGVDNKINRVSFQKFINLLEIKNQASIFKVLIAGSVGKNISSIKNVEILGYVDSLQDFFAEIDIFVNPVEFSSGQKIKLADAINYEIPFLSTKNGSEGLPITSEYHCFNDIEELVNSIFKKNIDYKHIEKLKLETTLLKQRLINNRNNRLDSLERMILEKRKITVLHYEPLQDSYLNSKYIIERMEGIKSHANGSGLFLTVLDDSFRNQEIISIDHMSVSEFCNLKKITSVDTLIEFGNSNKKLQAMSRKTLVDGISHVSKSGFLNLQKDKDIAYWKKAGINNFLEFPVDIKFKYDKKIIPKYKKIYILASNYSDFLPKVIKNVLCKGHSTEIIYPHQFAKYESIQRYESFLDVCLGIVFFDSTDHRYSTVKAIATKRGVPLFAMDAFLNAQQTYISSSALLLTVLKIPNLFKKHNLDSGRVNSTNQFWHESPELWKYLRA